MYVQFNSAKQNNLIWKNNAINELWFENEAPECVCIKTQMQHAQRKNHTMAVVHKVTHGQSDRYPKWPYPKKASTNRGSE